MKKLSNLILFMIASFFVYHSFFYNRAEADARSSYQSYLSGNAIFIDVREEDEVKQGMIKGALWVPLSKIEKDLKKEISEIKSKSLKKEIFLYCRSGNRSGKVQEYLKDEGIKSKNLGGFNKLVEEGLPTQATP